MTEEGGGGHSDSGSSSAIGSAQRLPPPPPPPPPGSQAPPAPTLAPDQLPQNNTLVALPIVAIENILSFMSYDEISQLRLVRPPRDPRRPLRRAEVWGGTESSARPPGREPPASPAGTGARSASLSTRSPLALASGACPDSALAPELGRLPGRTSPWGALLPRPEAGPRAGREVAGAGLRPSPRPEPWTPRGPRRLPFVPPSSPWPGSGEKNSRGGETVARPPRQV